MADFGFNYILLEYSAKEIEALIPNVGRHESRIRNKSGHHKIIWLLWQFLRVSPLFVQTFLLFVSKRRQQQQRKKKSRTIFYTTITAFSAWKRLEWVYFFLHLLLWCPCTQRLNTDYYTTNRTEQKENEAEKKKSSTTQRICWVYISFSLSVCLVTLNLYRPFVSFIIIYFCCCLLLCIFVCSEKFNRIIYEYKWKKEKIKSYLHTEETV